ncbi:class I SAM-dependent methyltransferase [Streptomyces sp. NPDC046915]|uniref:class I SAM-dependent methyltransferase n=1 Tax=Streptomyces sp. NPDC046915 TaxID=3155257 RepID=UPI00340A3A11
MVDRSFAQLSLASLYDALNPWGPGDDFYLGLVMSARSVLDVGCGTGRLLARARRDGHRGRLTGLDPAAAMLVQARRREPGVEWVLGDVRTQPWGGEFDLVVMTGHAFQVLLTEEELRLVLGSVRAALADRGRFVFETRNPAARAWTRWTPDRVDRVSDTDGRAVRVWREVEGPLVGDRVTFEETFEGEGWDFRRLSRSTLRFTPPDTLSRRLREAGLGVLEQFGDWDRKPLTLRSPEIITVAGSVHRPPPAFDQTPFTGMDQCLD